MLSQHFFFADITVSQQKKSADAIMSQSENRKRSRGRSLVITRAEKFLEKAVTALLVEENLLIIKRNELV